MQYWTEYVSHKKKTVGKRKKVDNNIYTFDIETTSYIILNDKIYAGIEYDDFTDEEKENCIKCSCMYEWTFSINEDVYYGRTWEEFEMFLNILDSNIEEKKIIFVHNLAFEFQFIKDRFNFKEVFARDTHKTMFAIMSDYNIEFRCTLLMSNCALDLLPKLFGLPVKKLKGNLDYTKIRTKDTILNNDELNYCENDCLVVYYYILELLKTYERVDKIPRTSTGQVRNELKELIEKDWSYKNRVKKAINVDPHVYNLLIEAFAGGFTHANWLYAGDIVENVKSYDFTSSYPYVMVTHRYPATEFKKCKIKKSNQMLKQFAYILVVRFKNIKSKYYTTYISMSKARNIHGGRYDNGRIIQADELEITLTDIDFNLILEMYDCDYEILEAYYSKYDYLPKQFIEFVLQKYVNKTEYKNVKGKEINYIKEKNKFNSLYGMSVTNTIRDKVIFENKTKDWYKEELTNEEIIEMLDKEKTKCFLSFAYGVWVTAYARNNLLRNVIKCDDYVVYCDTDSMKLVPGFDENVIKEYNEFVENKIKYVSKILEIPIEKFAPKDVKGVKHMLGLFDEDAEYEEFITQGAKKYAFTEIIKNKDINENVKVIKEIDNEKSLVMGITVSGVPKRGVKEMRSLKDFKDDLTFHFKNTNKNLLFYCENMKEIEIEDYQGHITKINDTSGCCLLPNTYKLSKSLEYAELISDNSSKRAIYIEKKDKR